MWICQGSGWGLGTSNPAHGARAAAPALSVFSAPSHSAGDRTLIGLFCPYSSDCAAGQIAAAAAASGYTSTDARVGPPAEHTPAPDHFPPRKHASRPHIALFDPPPFLRRVPVDAGLHFNLGCDNIIAAWRYLSPLLFEPGRLMVRVGMGSLRVDLIWAVARLPRFSCMWQNFCHPSTSTILPCLCVRRTGLGYFYA